VKRPNIHVTRIDKEEKLQAEGKRKLFSGIVVENFPNIGKDMDIQV
jgi:hypothetical protein